MKKTVLFSMIFNECRAGTVALTVYVPAKSESAVTLNRSNCNAYAAE